MAGSFGLHVVGPARCSQKLVLIYNTLVHYLQWLDLSVILKNFGEIIRFFWGGDDDDDDDDDDDVFCLLQNHASEIRHFWLLKLFFEVPDYKIARRQRGRKAAHDLLDITLVNEVRCVCLVSLMLQLLVEMCFLIF